jgi:hypothetical protein
MSTERGEVECMGGCGTVGIIHQTIGSNLMCVACTREDDLRERQREAWAAEAEDEQHAARHLVDVGLRDGDACPYHGGAPLGEGLTCSRCGGTGSVTERGDDG